MKTAALWLLPAFALTSVGSLTYATNKSLDDGDGIKKHDSKMAKTVHFEHDTDFDTYLTSVRSYMLVLPRNGLFGASRVPTFHGASRSAIPGYKELDGLAKSYSFSSFVVGQYSRETIDQMKQYQKAHRESHYDIPKDRITRIHSNWQGAGFASQQIDSNAAQIRAAVINLKALLDKKSYSDYSDEIKMGNNPSWIMAKAVVASDKACYSCHKDIKEGQPIGYVMAVIQKNQP